MTRKKNLSEGICSETPKCNEKSPKLNWLHHANALENFSCQNKFLCSNFLFSLPDQKPCAEGRSIACVIRSDGRVQSPQDKKAWSTLCGFRLACKNYLRPGITAPIVQKNGEGHCPSRRWDSSKDAGTASSLWNSSEQSRKSSDSSRHECLEIQQNFHVSHAKGGESVSYVNNSLPASEMSSTEVDACVKGNLVAVEGKFLYKASHTHLSSGNHIEHARQNAPFGGTFGDSVEDDDILKDIDVDQIVLEHYQTTGTPQSSASKLSPFTPAEVKDNITGPEGNLLPLELCAKCNHGFKVGLCPEAAGHLQEMKDMLIAISNELLDNADNLSPPRSEKLRQERLLLNKQVQQLEKYLHSSARGEERQKSHYSASTSTAKGSQSVIPQVNSLRIDPLASNSQVHMYSDPDSRGHWMSVPVSSSSIDRFGFSATVEREPFAPQVTEINYIEGSNDARWSSLDFPWTRKLEANNKKVFGNHSFRPNQREVINATMSGYDVFVLMPTGGGKSLTYQLPALICPGITLVVSPLVSLIQDQIMHLLQANIPATYLSANMEWNEQQDILRELVSDNCKYKLLYVTPEKVAKG